MSPQEHALKSTCRTSEHDLTGDTVFTESQSEMRSLGWALIQHDWCPNRERFGHIEGDNVEGHRDRPREEGSRDCHEPGNVWDDPKPEEAGRPLASRFQRERGPVHIVVSCHEPPGWWDHAPHP